MKQRCFGGLLAALALLLIQGCASYSDTVRELESAIVDQNAETGIRLLDKHRPSARNEALYQLNRAMLLRMNRQYELSNNALERAKKLIEQREALSVTEQTSTFIINETFTSFIGENYEQALIYFYAALNYIQLGDIEEARVEALQVDLLLKELAKKNSENQEIYTDDALTRYLAGMIYEELGEWSNALISYRKSYDAYQKYAGTFAVPPPPFLKKDLLRLTEQQGLKDEFKKYKETFPQTTWLRNDQWQERGEVVFILHNGLAPIKENKVLSMLSPDTSQLLAIALPAYNVRPDPVTQVVITVAEHTVQAVAVKDIAAIATQNLESRLPWLTARALARATIKYNIVKKVGQEQGELAGLIANLATVITEVADTRSWITLPSKIFMARIALNPGTYTLSVDVYGPGKQRLTRLNFKEVTVVRNHKTFIERHWADPSTTNTRPQS